MIAEVLNRDFLLGAATHTRTKLKDVLAQRDRRSGADQKLWDGVPDDAIEAASRSGSPIAG